MWVITNKELFRDGLRRCTICCCIKTLSHFHCDATRAEGMSNTCKECKKEYYNKNSETFKNRTTKWREDNRERYNEYQRNYYHEHKQASNSQTD